MTFQFIIIVIGLMLFEIISSVDNAVINAHVLKTLPNKYRKIFLFWGILFAVFVVRGCLPFLIIWIANPSLSFFEVISFAFSSGEGIKESVEESTPLLLLGGGMYLFLVFLAWLFLEKKIRFSGGKLYSSASDLVLRHFFVSSNGHNLVYH